MPFQSRFQQAVALHDQGQFQAASSLCLEILRENPAHAGALHLSGLVAYQIRHFQTAVDLIDKALAIEPDNAAFHGNHGIALKGLHRHDEALASYDRALALQPDYVEAHFNRGATLQELNRLEEALTGYDRAIALKPDYAAAWNNRAIVQKALGRCSEALSSYDQALALGPDYADAWYNRGNALMDLKRRDEALASYERAVALGLDYGFLSGCIAHARSFLCDWSCHAEDIEKLRAVVAAGERITPFTLLALVDDAALHRLAAEIYGRELTKVSRLPPPAPASGGQKIHLAYLSADFHNHATAYLMAELFERHDRDRFELTAISFGPAAQDGMRARVCAAFDRFIDARMMSDVAVARLCRGLGVDIALDLKGYTTDCRPGILAERCAPLQLNYLGYPGTMGASFIDYIVADRTLITEEDLPHYTEKVIWLPGSYQVNDRQRAIAEKTFTRAECGLPANAFVFCCFNNNYKITPATFDGWMRIMARVPGSVLWLLECNPTAATNLKKEALARGIAADRLIFGKPLPLPEHLARHRLADCFLDTSPYNAHTTASDALWAGLPVLTLAGQSFPARVAASLLKAVALPELIATTQEDYENLAVALAHDPSRLAGIRARLQENRLSCALFDSGRFARNLEKAFAQAMERHRAGLEPDHLSIEETDDARQMNQATATETPSKRRVQSATALRRPAPVKLARQGLPGGSLAALLGLSTRIEIMDVGAACITETPIYKKLLAQSVAHLHAFEGDERHIDALRQAYGATATVHPEFLFDGTARTVYLAAEDSGMTSLLPPRQAALQFFNGFEKFGQILRTAQVKTARLDDVAALPRLDMVKMDIQGAELTVLQHGAETLRDCVAIQVEVSYICLYEGQPSFGDVDVWMRARGFVPHCFLDIKRWSIAPTVRTNDFRVPVNQLLESDIVYIRDPLTCQEWTPEQLHKLAIIAHDCLGSTDLAVYLIRELARRDHKQGHLQAQYLAMVNAAERLSVVSQPPAPS